MLTPDQAKYRRRDLIAMKISSEVAMLCSRSNGSAIPVPPALAELIARCDTFATADEHVERLKQDIARLGLAPDACKAVLGELKANGFFVSAADLARTEGSPQKTRKIASIAIPSSHRLSYLKRCLDSAIDHCSRFGHRPEFIVANNWDSDEGAAAVTELLGEAAKRLPGAIRFIGRAERYAYIDELCRTSGVERSVCEFALSNPFGVAHAPGINRNSIMLDTIGTAYLSCDDDTYFKAYKPHNASEEIGFRPVDSDQIIGFETMQEALDSPLKVEDPAFDWIAHSERLVGRPVSDVLAEAGDAVDWNSIEDKLLQGVLDGRAKVGLVRFGLFGDSGSDSGFFYLFAQGALRERLVAEEGRYRAICKSRIAINGASRRSIGDVHTFMSPMFACDNTEGLPPFMPCLRGQDDTFGLLVRTCLPQSYVAFEPWSVAHAPERGPISEAIWESANRLRFSHLVRMLIEHQQSDTPYQPFDKRLEGIGRRLRAVGSLSERDFSEMMHLSLWARSASFIATVESTLAKHKAQPSYWADDMRACITRVNGRLTSEDYIMPSDVLAAFGKDNALKVTQAMLRRFGELLEAWPAVLRAASVMRSQGMRLSREVT